MRLPTDEELTALLAAAHAATDACDEAEKAYNRASVARREAWSAWDRACEKLGKAGYRVVVR